jgi:putative DNA primase/helicase
VSAPATKFDRVAGSWTGVQTPDAQKAAPAPAPKPQSKPLVSQMIFRSAADIKPKRIKWLWNQTVPLGKITLFAGNPDNGKSMATTSLAALCTRGRDFPDCPNTTPASDVLMFLGEDDLDDTVIPRLMAADADMSKVHFATVESSDMKEREFQLDRDLPGLEAGLQQYPNTRLLIIDPISNYLGGKNMIAEQEMRRILVPLKDMAARLGIAIIIVMHLNKKVDLDAINRVGGAMAFIGVARCSWLFVRDVTEDGMKLDTFSMIRLKNNLAKASAGGHAYHIDTRRILTEDGEDWPPCVIWDGAIQKSAEDALGKTHGARGGARLGAGRPKGSDVNLQVAISFLEEVLQDGSKTSKWIFAQGKGRHGCSETTLRRAAADLHIKPFEQGGGWGWEMSPINASSGEGLGYESLIV